MKKAIAGCAVLALAAAGALTAQDKSYRDPGLDRIVQVAIVCHDVATCAGRWANLLGVAPPEIKETRPGREVGLAFRGKPSDARVKLAFLKLGQVSLELMEPVGAGSAWEEGLRQNGEGVHHVAFQVRDMGRTIESFAAQGMAVVHRGKYDGGSGEYSYIDSKAKLGVMIELLHSYPKP